MPKFRRITSGTGITALLQRGPQWSQEVLKSILQEIGDIPEVALLTCPAQRGIVAEFPMTQVMSITHPVYHTEGEAVTVDSPVVAVVMEAEGVVAIFSHAHWGGEAVTVDFLGEDVVMVGEGVVAIFSHAQCIYGGGYLYNDSGFSGGGCIDGGGGGGDFSHAQCILWRVGDDVSGFSGAKVVLMVGEGCWGF